MTFVSIGVEHISLIKIRIEDINFIMVEMILIDFDTDPYTKVIITSEIVTVD